MTNPESDKQPYRVEQDGTNDWCVTNDGISRIKFVSPVDPQPDEKATLDRIAAALNREADLDEVLGRQQDAIDAAFERGKGEGLKVGKQAGEALATALNTIVRGLRDGWWGEGSGEMESGELLQAEDALRLWEGQRG